MSADRRALTDLATSIADGAPIDWGKIEQTASPAERRIIRHLRLVSNVAELYRSLPADAAHGPGGTAGEPEGPRWGHLVLLDSLGRGTSGEVHRAWDLELHREVALKLFPEDPTMGPQAHASILAEARRLARVRHPNVATVYGADRDRDRVGFWMELVHGASLQDLVDRDGVFGAREAAGIGIELCAALAAVHTAGLLHRDVKTQNVLRESGGRIVLTDFGTGEELGTTFTRMAGTPMYLAPEILAGKPATVQTDLYSLGVLLFYLVTREFPIRAKTMPDLVRAHKAGGVRHLRDVRPDLPAAFVEVVERLLATEPGERFQSAGSAEAALRRALMPATATQTAGGGAGLAEATKPAGGGHRWLFAAAAVTLLAITAALIVWSTWSRPGAPPAATRVAVLPMRAIDPTTVPPFFAEGLTDQLVSTLGRIASLRILSAAPGDDPTTASWIPEGAADAILETTLLTSPGGEGAEPSVRVNARLLSAGGGPLLWSDSLTYPLGETFSLQAAIAREIASRVNAATTSDEQSQLAIGTRGTTPQAAAAFFEGRAHVETYGIAGWLRAQHAFERAIAADPGHAAAHAGLARALFTLGHADEIPQGQARARALSHAEQAVALDPTLPEAHATLGDIAFYYDWNWRAAEERYRHSLDVNPSFTYGRMQYAQMLAAARRTSEAVTEARLAVDLHPTSGPAWERLGMMRYYHGDFPGASEAIARALEIQPQSVGAWILAGRLAEAAGRLDEAGAHTDRAVKLLDGVPALLRIQQIRLVALRGEAEGARAALGALRREFSERGQPWNPQFDAYVHLALGEHGQALDSFEAALAQRHWSLLWLGVDPRLAPLRDHPRLQAILRSLGAP